MWNAATAVRLAGEEHKQYITMLMRRGNRRGWQRGSQLSCQTFSEVHKTRPRPQYVLAVGGFLRLTCQILTCQFFLWMISAYTLI